MPASSAAATPASAAKMMSSSGPPSVRTHHQIEPQQQQQQLGPEQTFDRSITAAAIVPIKTKLRPTSPAFYPAGFAHKDEMQSDEPHDKIDKSILAPIVDHHQHDHHQAGKAAPATTTTSAADEAAEVVVLGAPLTGVVHNLKHAYGFVKCEATGERIFFHYSDIDPSTTKTFGPVAPDLPPVIIGDEVRFYKVIDEPTGKQKAVKVEVVRRPARNLIVEPKPELLHQESAASHGTAVADDYKSVHDPTAPRETGVVVSAKQNYGFIKCAEREHKQVFFHFSEVIGVQDPATQIQPGLEVLFSLSSTATGRVVATRIQALPPGTISFYTIESSVLYGFIDRGLESSHTSSQKTRRRARPSSNDSGSLILPAKERSRLESVTALPYGHDSIMSFTGVDLKFPGIRLVHGDQVGFRLKLDRRTQAYSATDIFLIRCAPTGRKRGIVTIWKDLYGFLKMDGSAEQMFVHQNEFIEKTHRPAVGDELEFNIAPDNHGQENAIRISVLPRGTVQLFDDRVFGVVVENPSLIYPSMPEPIRRALTAEQHLSPSATSGTVRFNETTPLYGAIRLLHDQCNPSQLGQKLRYRVSDSNDPSGLVRFVTADLDPNAAAAVRTGDIVSLALAPAPKFQRCANVQLLPKQGTISAVANNQIVIKVEGRDISGPELFEFLCDDGAEVDLQVGEKVEIDQIEAGIAPMSMRIARRLRTLKPNKHGPGQHVGRNHKPTLKKSVSMDLSPSSYRRWDLRLEPRNWS